jgi:ABC-type phosphate transport system substrate-binding protein
MKKASPGLVGLIVILALTACSSPSVIPTPTTVPVSVTPESVRFAYPDALAPLARAWVSSYQRISPAVEVVSLERADPLAWQALTRDEVDVAAVTWFPTEPSTRTWRISVARGGLAVVVHPQNGVPGVTLDQLRDLFQGRTGGWESLGGLPGSPALISREDASGDARFFQNRVMGDLPVALTAILAPNTEAMLQFVGERPLAVGYVPVARLDGRVRSLALEGVPPSPETLQTRAYPLVRDVELVVMGEPQGAVRDFVQWALSPEGQTVTAAQGWVTLSAAP